MKHSALIYILLLLTTALSGCTETRSASVQVWIDAPLDGAKVEAGIIQVQSHAVSRSGIGRVEMRINGELYRSDENPTPDERVIYLIQSWIPTETGDYTVEVRAHSADNANISRESITVHVIGGSAEATETPTAEFVTPASPLPTTPIPPTATAQPQVKFWADDAKLEAGDCTTIHWETAHVQAVFFDEQEVVGVGAHQICPCSSESYSLDVQLPDGAHDIRSVEIEVTGSCASPTPDSAAPPAPALVGPQDEWTADCSPPQVELTWETVSDPSGVTYKIVVESNSTDEWQPYDSWQNLEATSVILKPASYNHTLPCTSYRWRVQAIDGAENAGEWSAWFHFAFTLP